MLKCRLGGEHLISFNMNHVCVGMSYVYRVPLLTEFSRRDYGSEAPICTASPTATD